ncbi:unnamed protein product [Schistocephalus solidus]|uniref:DnaJ_C domain-containing protein n=1 Tax=Schistocephalus solidus TaxID=70667 RepID=A0A183S7G9_SCHSO|nr:unnamed protein product [Schistocephalus solidus]
MLASRWVPISWTRCDRAGPCDKWKHVDSENIGGGDLCSVLEQQALGRQSLCDGFTSDRPDLYVTAPSQLHLPQHGVGAEDSGPLQDFRVRDPVLPSRPQYSAEAAEMEVIQLPGLVRVDVPGLRSLKKRRQDDGLLQLQFGVQVNTLAIPHGGLQSAEGLTCIGDPLRNLVIDSRVA